MEKYPSFQLGIISPQEPVPSEGTCIYKAISACLGLISTFLWHLRGEKNIIRLGMIYKK
jgi:hypothetical protein